MTKGPAKTRNAAKGPPDGARGGRSKLVAQNKKARHDYTIEDVVEAGMAAFGGLLACGFVAQGWRLRATATGRLLVLAFGLSLLLVACWGAWWGGFPQPSELGWLSRPFSRSS